MGSKKYKYGFVLGGGGARGFSHLGAIQALIEKGIKPDVISGVSAGSIVGAFLASGLTPNETLELLKNKGVFNFSKIHFPISGLLSLDGIGVGLVSEESLSLLAIKACKDEYRP